ncbi:hypothetical protein N5D61_03535 [Pseudomonas sp. GD03842]|uniref:hypothetical protein n=1 Tax=unclassified Pseudomonas TaxID=196821 RepID=UPI000D35CA13|nr:MULTISPECIES: hypothetical protein [unclassified Pseudomonas]MDH0745417.1 hypothetical protein [Pseudomonas sp. GD03842]RAU45197.1 hypothetical protein DBP26_014845 [Pseudomonas sp. RIT 409]RAU51353.1 hypothetical protein DBY65_019865 [Pseudomonas sp. RIT 412]
MDEIDNLTRAKLREWQMRRLEIKDRMQSQPEKTLELSRLLDLMDEEHAAILAASTRQEAGGPGELPVASENASFALQLSLCASSLDDLRKLLDMAVHEVQREIDGGDQRRQAGGMSGSLGDYRFELTVPSVSLKS